MERGVRQVTWYPRSIGPNASWQQHARICLLVEVGYTMVCATRVACVPLERTAKIADAAAQQILVLTLMVVARAISTSSRMSIPVVNSRVSAARARGRGLRAVWIAQIVHSQSPTSQVVASHAQ